MDRKRVSARMAFRSAKPSSPGIITSLSTSAGSLRRMAASAAWPSATVSTSQRSRRSRAM